MHVKSLPQTDFFVRVGFVLSCLLVNLSFSRVVFRSSCVLVELVLVDLSWSSCRLVKLSRILLNYVDQLQCSCKMC
jgi:hypothetical protein